MQEGNRELREGNRELQEGNRELQEGHRELQEGNHQIQEGIRALERESSAAQRKWGELANKMGTLVEDIVAPGLPTVFLRVFGLDRLDSYGQRVHRRHRSDRGREREFDYVASAGNVFLVNETKSTLRPEDSAAFVTVLGHARDYLFEEEVGGKDIVGALAAFTIDPSLVAAGERQGLLMFGLGTGLLRVLNSPDFQPRRF
jgi:hypothetical protein